MVFCILVNGMAAKCKIRVKYVDDATAMEIIPRCSPSYLPFTVSDIYTYASLRGMKLNSTKCKEMIINFMQYSQFPLSPLLLGALSLKAFYKLLGVCISGDLSWNVHIEHIVKKANKRLFALRTLKKSGLTIMQLVQVYCSIVRSVLEYACPVWEALPKYLDDAIESVQKGPYASLCRTVTMTMPLFNLQSGITALSKRREEACTNFIKRDCLSSTVLKPLIPCVSIDRPYCLRSGERVPERFEPKTKRFADFCTIKYQDQL